MYIKTHGGACVVGVAVCVSATPKPQPTASFPFTSNHTYTRDMCVYLLAYILTETGLSTCMNDRINMRLFIYVNESVHSDMSGLCTLM